MTTDTEPRETLLTIPNHHRETDGGQNHPPEFDADRDFVAYMANQFGEQLVYVHPQGGEPMLVHGDMAWHPAPVEDDGLVPSLNLSREEVLFVQACYAASGGLRAEQSSQAHPHEEEGLESIVRAFAESGKLSPDQKRVKAQQAANTAEGIANGAMPTEAPDGKRLPERATQEALAYYRAWATVLVRMADEEEGA